jgi:cytochrome P450
MPRPGAEPMRGAQAARWYLRFFHDPIRTLGQARAQLGPVCAAGNVVPLPQREKLHVIALGPEYNHQVLGDPDRFRTTGQGVGGPRGSAQRRLRYGLTRSQRGRHERQRQFMLPPFQRKAVESYTAQMVAVTDKLLGQWETGSVVDLWREMRKLTLEISSEILFAREDPQRAHLLGEMIGDWLSASFSAPVWACMVDAPGTPYRALLRRAEAIEREVQVMLDEKRAVGAAGGDLVSMLVAANRDGFEWMSDEDLIGQVTIAFAASYETTANAMTWTLFLLAQHPQVARDLLDELGAVFGGAPPTLETLARAPLLEAVVKESLRILPPVPYTIRVARYRQTPIGPYVMLRGDRVILSHYVTHHLPELYANPERFDPQRWLSLKRGPYEYLPFSAGPRLCIGYSFAMQALRLSTAMILQRFRFSVLPGTRIDRTVRVTMSPKRGLPVSIHPPDGRFEAAPVRGNIREMVDL